MLREAVLLSIISYSLVFGSVSRLDDPPRPNLHTQIVGGRNAMEGEIPYQVNLLINGTHFCGGSVISEYWTVTAAHCLNSATAEMLQIAVGSVNIEKGLKYNISSMVIHPQYNANTYDYDIAVLKVDTPFEFNDLVNKIDLPEVGEDLEPEGHAIVSGWGYTSENGTRFPKNLQMITVPIVAREVCASDYTPASITERMICAGPREGGKDSCQGDSGGPLVIDGVLQGIVSWGSGCARPKLPGVYTKVSSVRNFILKHTEV